jgi:hypothetical protein
VCAANQNCLRRLPRRTLADSERVRSAIGVRLIASFPPAGPARLGTRVSARAPGSGSPVPASKPGKQIQRACAAVGQQKTLRSIWLGRVRVRSANCRSRLRRDRSHEPGTRYRSARGRSTVGRAFRVRGSSSDSWSFANPIVCEGAGHTPARGNCQLACETIFQWRERSVQRVAGKAHRPMLGRHRSMLTTGWPAGLHASSIAGNHTRQQKARHSTGGQRCRNRNLPLGGSPWSWRL